MKEALCIFGWPTVWSLGTGLGSPDFYHSLCALAHAFDRVRLVYPEPGGGGPMAEQLPPGIEAAGFRCPLAGKRLTPPGWAGAGAAAKPLRMAVSAADWLLRVVGYAAFTACAARAAGRAAAGRGPALVAAYGCQSALAGRILSKRLRVPLALRLFGVSLGPRGYSLPVLVVQFEETLGFKVHADGWIITDDGSAVREAAARLGVKPERLSVLRAAVDRKSTGNADSLERKEYRQRLGLPENARVVLRVSRLWDQQRIERLIEALPERLADGTPVAAVIVGDGPRREYLESLAARSAAKILFTGAVPNSALSEHYHSCDLYAATADRTNLSQSVLEALCYGVPVVALNTGRTADLIRELFKDYPIGKEKR